MKYYCNEAATVACALVTIPRRLHAAFCERRQLLESSTTHSIPYAYTNFAANASVHIGIIGLISVRAHVCMRFRLTSWCVGDSLTLSIFHSLIGETSNFNEMRGNTFCTHIRRHSAGRALSKNVLRGIP